MDRRYLSQIMATINHAFGNKQGWAFVIKLWLIKSALPECGGSGLRASV